MTETLRNRFQLCDQVADKTGLLGNQVLDVVQAIESLGLRIVPHISTDEMNAAGIKGYPDIVDIWDNMLSQNPFAPENPNG